jgi:hypothetical protein
MKTTEIDALVQVFHDQEMLKIHACVNSTSPYWRQDEIMGKELRALDVRETRYRTSLGQPDDQIVEPAVSITGGISIALDATQAVAGTSTPVVPGVKQ